jgi:ATP-dependent Clp protease ATP-binding subunit ClpB
LEERDVRLEVTEAAKKAIATEGYDPTFGARPLKRVIQQRIQNPLATELLKGRIEPHGGVRVDFSNDEFTFEPLPPAAPTATSKRDGKAKTKVETVGVR